MNRTARPLWQRVLAGERLPKRRSRHPKCEGTVEDHRPIALHVRELIRKQVFLTNRRTRYFPSTCAFLGCAWCG
jgi:hypothetical protein